jgi:transcriptional regulator GlxA family with amidase domain
MGFLALITAGGAVWLMSLPGQATTAGPQPVSADETRSTLAALRPFKRRRPVIAVLGINDATETTDYLMPLGILRRADVAEVVALSTSSGPVNLYPALRVQPDATIAQFDAQYPEGADYVIVPAMEPNDDPTALAWIENQAAKGAILVGVCAGARVIANAGLLDGRAATTHWYYLEGLLKGHPRIKYVADRRFVVDGKVVTTTGITASIPLSLTLIEAIGGRKRAQETASALGVTDWDARHDSEAFKLTRRFAWTVLTNFLRPWKREELGLELRTGVDEVSLALVADAWSRTYRSRAVTFTAVSGPIRTENGVRVLPDREQSGWPRAQRVDVSRAFRPVRMLEDTLQEIARRYGAATAQVVSMQLEYSSKLAARAT